MHHYNSSECCWRRVYFSQRSEQLASVYCMRSEARLPGQVSVLFLNGDYGIIGNPPELLLVSYLRDLRSVLRCFYWTLLCWCRLTSIVLVLFWSVAYPRYQNTHPTMTDRQPYWWKLNEVFPKTQPPLSADFQPSSVSTPPCANCPEILRVAMPMVPSQTFYGQHCPSFASWAPPF